MPVGQSMKVACFKKLEDGSEVFVREFNTLAEACKWSTENKIMGVGWVHKSIKDNIYPELHYVNWRKYPNANKYRFEKICDYR
ncbi:hypothetical protein [Mesobacillus zeae]|uniref:Uncharacterized protein n=1 Tax=Mesobacillus zeae TaxID=1917180 RepID=A0A398B257_9BACI|nr:hypothetical protein [Mesobacillus zeae]RID83925.1 hypothetical protein D1970_15120 [Mesobacillus zeae]